MGEKEDTSLNLFKLSLPRLRKKFKPEKLYLFGSWAKGEALKNSDIDIVMVSPCFEGMKFLERMSRVLETIDPPFSIDLLCYTPEEFGRKKEEIGIIRESLKNKIDLLQVE